MDSTVSYIWDSTSWGINMTTVAMATNATIDAIEDLDNDDLQEQQGILSPRFIAVSTMVIYVCLNGVAACFGVTTNVVNLAVFWRQGFQEVVNLSLFALAVADLGSVFCSLLQSIGYGLWINDVNPTINFRHVQYLVAAYPHAMFARIGSFITAFISFERCLCVMLPLKVKRILTRKVAIVVIGFTYISVMASFSITYITMALKPQHDNTLNHSVVSLHYRDGQESKDLEDKFLLIISFYQIAAFVFVAICTVILVFKLQEKTQWRLKTVTNAQLESTTNRDKKVVKMVICISITFIVCFTPTCLQLISMYSFDDYGVNGRYGGMYVFAWSLCVLGEIVCASINIFFYYSMSSRYATILATMLPCRIQLQESSMFPASKTETSNFE